MAPEGLLGINISGDCMVSIQQRYLELTQNTFRHRTSKAAKYIPLDVTYKYVIGRQQGISTAHGISNYYPTVFEYFRKLEFP